MMVESPAKEWESEMEFGDQGLERKRGFFFAFGKKKKEPESGMEEDLGDQEKKGFGLKGFGGNKPKKEKPVLTKEQKKKRRKKFIIGGVVVVVLAMMILPKMFAPEQLPVVSVAHAEKGDVSQTISGSGTVRSQIETSYFSPVGATVESCGLQVGDIVERGDVLLTYDAQELENLYQQAKLTGDAGTYGYQDAITRDNENISEYNRSTHDIGILEQQVDDTEESVEHLTNRVSEFNGKQAESAQTLAAKQEMLAQLQKDKIAVEAELEAANKELTMANAELEAAKNELEQAKASQPAAQSQVDPVVPAAPDGGAPEGQTEGAEENNPDEGTQTAANDGQEGGDASQQGPAGDGQGKTNEAQDKVAAAQEKVNIAQDKVAKAQQNLDTINAQIIEAQKAVEIEQGYLGEVSTKLADYENRLKDANKELGEFSENLAKEKGIQSSSEAAQLTGAARSQLSTNESLNNLNTRISKEQVEKSRGGIQAEYSGVVTSVTVVEGGPVAQGSALFTIASNEDVVVEMSITRFDLEKMAEGQTATITMAGHTYTGTVTKLSRLAEKNEKGTPVVKAQVKIDNPDENVYLGLEANVSVLGRESKDVLVVPAETVNTGQDGSFCYVVENGIVVKKPVEIGLSSDTITEIVSGLDLGDQVICTGGMAIEEGMQVMAMEG